MMNTSHHFGVFEIGASAAHEVRRLSEIVLPDLALITNIHLEHTNTFGNLQQIAEGESEILSVLPENGIAVLPSDDPFYDFLKSKIPQERKVKLVSFGLSSEASVSVDEISENVEPVSNEFSTTFMVRRRDEKGHFFGHFSATIPLLGSFNVVNATAACAAAISLGVPVEEIQAGLKNFVPPKMRFQISGLPGGSVLVNDSYNANPGSMKTAIESFVRSFPDREKVVILGDMLELGEIARQEHYALGQFLAKLPLAKIVLFGPQSRFIAEGAMDSFVDKNMVLYCVKKEELVQAVQSSIKNGIAILFKASRGMRLEDVIAQCSII